MRKLILAAGLVLMAGGAQAATLNVVGGQLMGASNVLVDGSLYDVQFLDGSCIDLYNGCDDLSDFTFQTEASATLASQALLDQVFLDGVDGLFDADPALTNGCSDVWQCGIQTHFGFNPWPSTVATAVTSNNNPGSGVDMANWVTSFAVSTADTRNEPLWAYLSYRPTIGGAENAA
ncbi:MAG: hypothetical protein CMJ48_01855 [Planctomycetaceae bacterium]|nr:hypothetical protein [Planctomycetaceae bacterium]